MKEIVSKNLCTGCTVCCSICPVHAITMEEDSEGFKYPIINEEKCINCGLCQGNCPAINTKKNTSLNKCYVGYNTNEEVRLNSSSGGIFSLIADHVLDNKGIVIGASFDKDNILKHIAIEKKSDLNKLRSSKYLQSDLNNIYKYIKDNIKNRMILFSGTPCQIAGIKAYIKNDYNNLICVDVICHGVPTPKLFKKYIDELEKENNDKLKKYNFRDKSTGWNTYSNAAIFKKKKIRSLANNNPYMKLFLSDIALRKSCYDCNFKYENKYSDITLGDFWGVEKYYPKIDSKNGVSAIIVNTKKGDEIFNNISANIKCNECKIEEIIDNNPSLIKSVRIPKKRKQFFNDINHESIEKLKNKYTNQTFAMLIKRKIKKVIKILNKFISKGDKK